MEKRRYSSDSSDEEYTSKKLNERLKPLEKILIQQERKHGDHQRSRTRKSSTPDYYGRRRGYNHSPDCYMHKNNHANGSEHSYHGRDNPRNQSRDDSSLRESSVNNERESRSSSRPNSGFNTVDNPEAIVKVHPGGVEEPVNADVPSSTPEVVSQEVVVVQNQVDERADAECQKEEELENGLLQVLGDRLMPDRVFEPTMHKDLDIRLQEVITEGLPTKERKSLIKKFNLPENGLLVDLPKLNFEVKASLQVVVIKRDARIIENQERISASLAGLSKLVGLIFQSSKEKIVISEIASGVLKLLADLQHEESLIRRSLISKNIDTSMHETLNLTGVDEWLFGNGLEEKVKAAQVLEVSSKRLKPKTLLPSKNSMPKNWKGPPRRPPYKQRPQATLSGRKFQDQKSHPVLRSYYQRTSQASNRRKD